MMGKVEAMLGWARGPGGRSFSPNLQSVTVVRGVRVVWQVLI